MANHDQRYEIRCPIHGFVTINDWEREIINQPAFQRLRRIRQLAWTDQVYPGAMHTRFEHSLGVLHVATQLYDSIVNRSWEILRSDHAFNNQGLQRDRVLVRLTALLHDVGHTPFSHAAEDLFPPVDPADVERIGQNEEETEKIKRFQHEDYSAAIIRTHLKDAIEDHPLNQNYEIKADDIANLLEGKLEAKRAVLWRDLISGQLDADRIDYLLRDSTHTGVDYGKFDWRRLVNSVVIVSGGEGRAPRFGVNEGGFHAAEGLVLARYFMFTQVYFHKTRVAYNIHLQNALATMLPEGMFPRPDGPELDDYLTWSDWNVLGLLADGSGGEHGKRLSKRDHYREVYHTSEIPSAEDMILLDQVRENLGDLLQAEATSEKSTYKFGQPDIPIQSQNPGGVVKPLSEYSSVVKGLRPVSISRLYCRREDKDEAERRIISAKGGTA